MKKIAMLLIVSFLFCGCSFKKSEEGIVMVVDTASKMKGRTIDANVHIQNSGTAAAVVE